MAGVVLVAGCRGNVEWQPATREAAPAGTVATAANLKVAFIGDSGYGDGFRDVLQLIEDEGADLVLHQGDFDYHHDPAGFFATIDEVLGPDFPYLLSAGNHDAASWPAGCDDPDGCYAALLKERMARTGIEPDGPDLDDQTYAVTFRGLKLVFVGEDGSKAGDCADDAGGYACFIGEQFAGDDHIWRICGWHKNQHAMQVGGKPDEMGWAVYQRCIDAGAIIATGHEHSYERTVTLTDAAEQRIDEAQHPLVDGVPANPDLVRVGPGRSFVFVSGLGGEEMRDQDRCRPSTYPYGCYHEWASIYTRDQTGGAQRPGALFIEFGVAGDERRARGYFKTTAGEMVDTFDIVAGE
jgi:hypothetical protein